MLHPFAVDRRWPKGFGRPAMCASSVEPFSVERGQASAWSVLRIDRARELPGRIQSRRELIVEILALMDLPRRAPRDAWYEATSRPAPLEWLKDTFEQINNGRHPEFALPARIELVVPSILDFPHLDISIIDTRGIDQLTARADLKRHLEDAQL
jgi:hypothetical protein